MAETKYSVEKATLVTWTFSKLGAYVVYPYMYSHAEAEMQNHFLRKSYENDKFTCMDYNLSLASTHLREFIIFVWIFQKPICISIFRMTNKYMDGP